MKPDKESIDKIIDIFQKKWHLNLSKFEYKYSRTDLYLTKDDGTIREIEVKRRRFNSNRYPTTIIDLSKYNELIKRNACLIVMFDDRWAILTDVESAYLKTTDMYCKSTTYFGGNWRMDPKVELDLSKFKWYKYD